MTDAEPIRTHDAAALVKRDPVTIRRWISKGWLTRIGTSGRQALVDRGQVLAVDRALHRGERPAVGSG